MFGAKPQHEFQIWHVPDRSPVVVYSVAVVNRIAEDAVKAYQNTPSGGMDVCGVLYGTVEDGEVRVSASRSLPCEHRQGPDFSLSEKDESEWHSGLEWNRLEPELRGMQPVGWYVSHSRSGIALGEEELRVWNGFFPDQEQLVLVVRPHQGRPTRAGFFFRPGEGRPEVNSSLLEFDAGPPPRGLHELRFLDAGIDEPPPADLTEQPATVWRWKRPAAAAAGVILAGAAAGYYLLLPNVRQEPETAVAMHLIESGGQLRAVWDRSSATVLQASSAQLEVQDGAARLELPVSAALLKTGSWPIIRTTGSVRVRLRMNPYGEAAAEFVGTSPVPTAQQPLAASGEEIEPMRAQIAQLRSKLVALADSNNQLETQATALQARWNARMAAAAKPPAPAVVAVKPVVSAPASGPGQVT
ncbi:MAG: hypothetical protein JJE04_07355, partial [Acidobacteriia bacterium]|nr:hypothetical protein [Terriglobia bacterium]